MAVNDCLRSHVVPAANGPLPRTLLSTVAPGCQYTSLIKGVTSNENICNEELVQNLERCKTQRLDFRCKWERCEKGKLNAQIKDQHKFEAKPFPFGCDPEKICQTEKFLHNHISNRHSDFWPTRCLSYPSTKTFH
jgi:hypothetical protein